MQHGPSEHLDVVKVSFFRGSWETVSIWMTMDSGQSRKQTGAEGDEEKERLVIENLYVIA